MIIIVFCNTINQSNHNQRLWIHTRVRKIIVQSKSIVETQFSKHDHAIFFLTFISLNIVSNIISIAVRNFLFIMIIISLLFLVVHHYSADR